MLGIRTIFFIVNLFVLHSQCTSTNNATHKSDAELKSQYKSEPICLPQSRGNVFGGIVSVDKLVHDWGDVLESDGELSCYFEVKNISNSPQVITSVVKTCGCTRVDWHKGKIAPGQKVKIRAFYANDEGPHSFDKVLTVYFKDVKKPLLLHIRGEVLKERQPLEKSFPAHFGGIGLKKEEFKVGNLVQGEAVSTYVTVANISGRDITLSWADKSDQLIIEPATLRIKSGKTAQISVTVQSSRALWGKNFYYARPSIDGVKANSLVSFTAVTRENFSSMTEGQLAQAPKSYYEQKSVGEFEVFNSGKSSLIIYKVDVDAKHLKCVKSVKCIESGQSAVFSFELLSEEVELMPFVASIYTNDPNRPIMHFYIDTNIL